MDIGQFLKQGKELVIELDDEVKYVIDDIAAEGLLKGRQWIYLTALLDGKKFLTQAEKIMDSLAKRGPIDYLDKKK